MEHEMIVKDPIIVMVLEIHGSDYNMLFLDGLYREWIHQYDPEL